MQVKQAHIKLSDRDLFRLIDQAVRKERLYTNPALQRQDIMRRFGLRRQHLNAILNTYGMDVDSRDTSTVSACRKPSAS